MALSVIFGALFAFAMLCGTIDRMVPGLGSWLLRWSLYAGVAYGFIAFVGTIV